MEDESQIKFEGFEVDMKNLELSIFVDENNDQNWTFLYYIPSRLDNRASVQVINPFVKYNKSLHIAEKSFMKRRYRETREWILMKNPNWFYLYEGGMNFG